MRVPGFDREQVVAVAALALLLLACLFISGLLLQMRFDVARELAERRELLARLETRVRADAGRSIAAAPRRHSSMRRPRVSPAARCKPIWRNSQTSSMPASYRRAERRPNATRRQIRSGFRPPST